MTYSKRLLLSFVLLLATVFITSDLIASSMVEFYKETVIKAEKGNQDSLNEICGQYKNSGVILIEDESRVFKLIEKAAHDGDACSQYSIGSMYSLGRGTPVNHEKAITWYKKSAEDGDILLAQTALGEMYFLGQGTPINNDLSFYWHMKAACRGNSLSQFRLGYIYSNGKGVPVDHAKAFRWYKKAAEQNQLKSQFLVGVMYAKGEGVNQSIIKAYKWLSIAMDSNHGPTSGVAKTTLELIAPKMTPSEIITAQAEAKEWWENKKMF